MKLDDLGVVVRHNVRIAGNFEGTLSCIQSKLIFMG